jgi:hypothetical protein
MAETVIHPRLTGIWPDGEPMSVRDAADRLAQARRDRLPVIPGPREAADRPEPARTGRRSR